MPKLTNIKIRSVDYNTKNSNNNGNDNGNVKNNNIPTILIAKAISTSILCILYIINIIHDIHTRQIIEIIYTHLPYTITIIFITIYL